MRPHIVIIGGGFAGLSALLTLQKHHVDAKITLIDQKEHFEYLPALHLCLTDTEQLARIQFSYKKYYQEYFMCARVTKVTSEYVLAGTARVRYDYLVVATGSVTNTFGNASFARYAHSVKSVADVQHALPAIATARRIAVIGAGYTGVEVASVLAADTTKEIHIIDADKHVLRGVNTHTKRVVERYLHQQHVHFHLGDGVRACTQESVVLASGKAIASDVHLLVAGITPNDAFLPDIYKDLTSSLAVRGHRNVFVCGDAARSGVPATGHNAMLEGRHVGETIARTLKEVPIQPFNPPKTTLLGIALGHYWGVVPVGKKSFATRLVGLLKWAVEQRCLLEFKYKIMLPL